MESKKIVFRFVSISLSVLIALLVIFGLYKVGTFAYEFGYKVFTEGAVDEAPGKDVSVQISSDMSDGDIAVLLENKGLIQDANLFRVQLKLSAYSGKLNSGKYTLNTSMTAREMIVMLAEETENTETEADEKETETENMVSTEETGA